MCAYCEHDMLSGMPVLHDIDGGGCASVHRRSGMLVFEAHDWRCPGYGIRINNCPACGRELEGAGNELRVHPQP